MIILDATTKKLQILTDATATTTEPSWVTSYAEIVQSTQALSSGGSSDGATTGTTAVDIVAAPASGDYRVIKSLHIFNNDTVNRTITVRYNDNGTNRVIQVSTLVPNSALVYEDGAGWYNGKAPFLPLAGGTMTGAIQMPDGSAASPSLYWDTNRGFFNDSTNIALGIAIGGVQTTNFSATGFTISIPGGNAACDIKADAACNMRVGRYIGSTAAPQYTLRKARGTIASPAIVATNDICGIIQFQAQNATSADAFTAGAQYQANIIETSPSPTAMGMRHVFSAAAIGSVTLTEIMRLDVATGLSMGGANTVIDPNRNIIGGAMASASQKTVPTTGFSTTINNNVGALIMAPAGTLATGTVTMPATPINNQEVVISSTQIITALTVSANTGQSINGAVSTLAANGFARYKYILADTAWYRVG